MISSENRYPLFRIMLGAVLHKIDPRLRRDRSTIAPLRIRLWIQR